MGTDIIQLCLSYIFLNSGATKLGNLSSSWQRLKIPAPELRGPTGVGVLATVEVSIAAALLVPASAQAGLMLSAWLLSVYTVGIVRTIARLGILPDCGCTPGRPTPADWAAVTRNLMLQAAIVFAAIDRGVIQSPEIPTKIYMFAATIITGVALGPTVYLVLRQRFSAGQCPTCSATSMANGGVS